MPPDEDGGGRGQGLAMLRLEARRYKREMQQIWMQRRIHEQKKSTSSFSSEDSSRAQDDKWRFSDTFTTSPATSGTPMFWNREDVPVSRLEQLAIVDERTQTDTPSKSEVQTETEKLQIDDDVISVMNESKTVSSATNIAFLLKTCSRHCDELRSRISQEAACECLADAAVRVNADVVFTAKPKRVAVEGRVETPDCSYLRAFRPAETGIVSHTSTMATSPTVCLDKGQKSTDPVQDGRIGLRSLVSPVPQRDSACSPIHNLHGYGARYTSLGDTSKGTTPSEMFSWQHDRPAPERSSGIAAAPFSSTQVSTPRPEVSCGGIKAGDNTSDFSTEISGSKRIRIESTGEGAMAARLATKIKHALEAISGKGDTQPINSTFILPDRAIQSTSACRLHYKDQTPEMKLFEDASESRGGRTLNDKEIVSSDYCSLPETCQQTRKAPVSSSQHHTISPPCSDADIYFEKIMAALCTDRYTPKKLSGSCIAGQVSPARALKSADRRAEAARRANVKSCGDHHASNGVDGIENSVKTDVRQSGSKHAMEKQRLLSNVQKLQNVAETAKRLYTDLVDCANDELRASADCTNLVKHRDGESTRDVSKFSRSEFCPSTEIISAHRANVASKDEVCGRCHVCQPQCDDDQPPEEAQSDSLDEITIQLSDASPTNIMVSRNGCTERPGFNVEVSTPCELPCQRVCSPTSRGGNFVRRGRASWKDLCKPAPSRMRPAGPGINQQVKKGSNKCLVDPRCDGPRDSCHMPTRRKSSRASTIRFSPPKKCSTERLLDSHCNSPRNSCHVSTRAKCSGATTICISPPKRDFNKCLLDPRCDGSRNSCHMPTGAKCSGATAVSTVCISPPEKDSNLCCLDSRCVGSRDSCHMPTYAKSTRASCGPGSSSRANRNKGTKLGSKDDPSGLSGCLVHRRRGMEPVKGKLESNPYCARFRSAGKVHTNSLHDEKPGHISLHERIHRSPARRSRDLSKFPNGCLDSVSNVDTLSEARDNRNLCMIHDMSSSMKGKETKIANGGHEETAGLHHSWNERMDLNNPVKNAHRSFQECSRIRGVNNHSMLTATEDIQEGHSSVGKDIRQPAVRHVIGNASTLSEAYTQTTQPHNPEADYVDRAVAAAELAKDIEVLIADQLGKSNRRIRESNYSMSRRKLSEAQKDSFGQTKLDVGVIAAANAVKKLKPVSFLPLVKHDEGNQKATPRKGPTTRAKLMVEDTFGSSFYDQMYKELEELSSERMQLVRQERAQFRSQSLFFPLQAQERRAGFSIKERSSSDLKNLANGDRTEFEESRRSWRMQTSGESQSFWNEPIGSHTPGSKRQRSGTSPARKHGNKLLRLSVGKADSQACRKKQGQHSTFSASLNQAVRTSNKGLDKVGPINFGALNSGIFRRKGRSVSELDVEKLNGPSSAHFGLASASRMSSSSFGRWKPAPEEARTKTTAKRKVLTTRKIRAPAWVERMSKAKNVFSSLLRPLLQARFRKESQPEAIVRKRTSRPSGLMVRPSITSKQLVKHIPGGGGFSLVQPISARKHGKKSIAPIQYDISTGRKIVNSEQEPGELLQMRVENQHVRPNSKSLHEKNTRLTMRPVVKHGMKPSAVANLGGDYIRIKGWNADPLIRSNIPHKPADIIRYNRNGGLDVQIRKRDAGGKHKSSSNSVGRMNIRHVTFAGMVVHNSRNGSTRKGFLPPQSIDSLQTQVASKKASASQRCGVSRALGKRRSSSATKTPPTQGKLHRYGGGGGKWTYHEGFWTEMFKPELENVSQTSTPTLRTAQVVKHDTLRNPLDRAGAKDLLTVESSFLAKRTDDEDVTGIAGEKLSCADHTPSSAISFGLRNDSDVQRLRICTEGDGKSQSPALFKSLGFVGSDALEGGAIIDHSSVVATKVFSSPSLSNEEDERVESFSETKSTIMLRQAQVSMIDCPRHDDTERLEQRLCSEESSQLPLRLLDDVFPESTENEALVSMFDRLHEATSIHIEAHSEVRHPASESITQQRFPDAQDRGNEGQLRKLQLERALMDMALQTILQDNPLQVQDVAAARTEPISLPIKRRAAVRADKEVEAIVFSHDMSQSPLFNALSCVDRSTEQDITPHVDRATELDVVPHVDRATELDVVPHVDRATGLESSSLFFKDQDSQTADAEFRIQNTQMFASPTQEKCGDKVQSARVHHQAIKSRVPCNTVGIQMPGDNFPTIVATPPYPPAAMPMLMPVFFQQLGMSMLPVALPTVHLELPARITTPSTLQPSPVSFSGTENFQTGVDQGTQATESHVQPNPGENAAQAHQQVSKLPISSRAAIGQLGVCEEESDSDWEESKRGSSPATPSTPVSSPGHKLSLKRAMQLCPDNSSIQEAASAGNAPQPLVSEMCQVSSKDDLQVHQVLRNEFAPPIQMVTEMIVEEITAEEPLQITSTRDTRRGTSWAKVKEMEEAAIKLLRAASMKTPSATSSSECSREFSPEVYTWMSPGEVNIEEVGRSSTSGRFRNNSRTSQVDVCQQTQSHEWSWFGCGRASVGEIYNPVRFLGSLSEGEIEAGAVPSVAELGQIQNEYNRASPSATELQGRGSEPGEYLVLNADASPPKSPTHPIVY